MRWLALLWIPLVACGGPMDDDDSAADDDDVPPMIPPECEDVLRTSHALSILTDLDAVGRLDQPYWANHEADDFVTVLFAQAEDETCAVIHRGEIRGYGTLSGPPNLLTPLFGYLLPWTQGPDWVQPLADAAAQGDEWADWLGGHGVERATLMPADEVSLQGTPVSAADHAQIAVHEGFHVDVQMPNWFGEGEHPWPAWDQQPARSQIPVCYSQGSISGEQDGLADAVEAAWAGDIEEAIDDYDRFMANRSSRRANLSGESIESATGGSINCTGAESILELEEGLAEYAAWAMLRSADRASDAEVLSALRATTDEPFYAFGAGQALLALALDPQGFPQWVDAVANPENYVEGSVEAVTRATVNALR